MGFVIVQLFDRKKLEKMLTKTLHKWDKRLTYPVLKPTAQCTTQTADICPYPSLSCPDTFGAAAAKTLMPARIN
jgi:hypothetical protein